MKPERTTDILYGLIVVFLVALTIKHLVDVRNQALSKQTQPQQQVRTTIYNDGVSPIVITNLVIIVRTLDNGKPIYLIRINNQETVFPSQP